MTWDIMKKHGTLKVRLEYQLLYYEAHEYTRWLYDINIDNAQPIK